MLLAVSWVCRDNVSFSCIMAIHENLTMMVALFSLLSATEDVEIWFAEVENLLAVEDLGKVQLKP